MLVQGCRRGSVADELSRALTFSLRPLKEQVCFLCRVRERVDWVGLTLG